MLASWVTLRLTLAFLSSVLSGDAFAALQDFYSEKDQREKDFEELKNKAENNEQLQSTPLSMNMFSEDWNASQFWVENYLLTKSYCLSYLCQYSDETATLLAKELLCDATATTRIAIVSAPSVFIQIKNLLVPIPRLRSCVERAQQCDTETTNIGHRRLRIAIC